MNQASELFIMILRWLLLAFTVTALVCCQKLVRDPQIDAEAKRTFDEVRLHQTDAFLSHLDSILDKATIRGQLPDVQRLIPSEEPLNRKPLGTNITDLAGKTVAVATDEYDYPDRTLIAQIRLFKFDSEGVWTVQGFQTHVASAAQLASSNFTLIDKRWDQYAFLLLALASPITIVAAVVKVTRTSKLKRKWLWVIAALLGFCAFRMNWTTGALSFDLLSFQVFGVGALREASPFAPWIISVALPINAILILTRIWANPHRAGTAP